MFVVFIMNQKRWRRTSIFTTTLYRCNTLLQPSEVVGWSRVVLRLIVDQNEVDRLEAMFNNGVRQITRGNFLSSNLQVASCQFHYFLV